MTQSTPDRKLRSLRSVSEQLFYIREVLQRELHEMRRAHVETGTVNSTRLIRHLKKSRRPHEAGKPLGQ